MNFMPGRIVEQGAMRRNQDHGAGVQWLIKVGWKIFGIERLDVESTSIEPGLEYAAMGRQVERVGDVEHRSGPLTCVRVARADVIAGRLTVRVSACREQEQGGGEQCRPTGHTRSNDRSGEHVMHLPAMRAEHHPTRLTSSVSGLRLPPRSAPSAG